MKVFVTGATGFIGSAVIPQLLNAGHQVLGLTRSDHGALAIKAAGAEPHRGSLEDLDSLERGAAQADAVIHTAFIHDGFDNFRHNSEVDQKAIEALGSVLKGLGKRLIVSAGIGRYAVGRPVTEEDLPPPNSPVPRVSEQAAAALAPDGVSVGVMRLPQVHDTVKQGLVTFLIAIARRTGKSAYIGTGENHWVAAHISDVAVLYRMALEENLSVGRYHAVAEGGVTLREIAETIGRGLKLPVVSLSPEDGAKHFGSLAMFVGADVTASSKLTRERLGWNPTGPSLITDLQNMNYSAA